MKRIGIISDTHGTLREEALAVLAGSTFILHAGDIGKPQVLEGLSRLAPVHAIRGNVDRGAWAADLPATLQVDVGGLSIFMLHDVKALDPPPCGGPPHAVVSGHSHQPSIQERDGVLYVNPGSAGPRRFRLPVCVGSLHLEHGRFRAEIIDLGLTPRP